MEQKPNSIKSATVVAVLTRKDLRIVDRLAAMDGVTREEALRELLNYQLECARPIRH